MTDRKWHGGFFHPDPDYEDDEIYKSGHTLDSFGYSMENVMEFDDDGKVVREEDDRLLYPQTGCD